MADPVVAVLVRLWNNERTVVEALDSLWAQDYRGRIVVRFALDRGATDATHRLVREYADAHSRDRVEWVLGFHEHMNLLGATRWLLPRVEEEFAFILDGDDLWYPYRIRRHMAVYPPEAHLAVSAAGYFYARVTEENLTVPTFPKNCLPIVHMREVVELEHLLRSNFTGLGAARVEGRYLRERLAPAYAGLTARHLEANAVEDYFALLVAAWDHELCSHDGEALWIQRLVGRRPWEIAEDIDPRMVAARQAFLRWAESHPSLRPA
jgi:hypothetical protein